MANMKLTHLLTTSLFLLAATCLTGCQKTPDTDGPVSATEQEELQDQLDMIEKAGSQKR